MLEKLKKLVWLNKGDLWLCAGLPAGLFLLIQIIIAVVMIVAKPQEGVQVSDIILVGSSPFIMLGLTCANLLVIYIQAVQFGSTRRRGMLLTMGLIGVEYLVTVAVVGIAVLIEKYVCPGFWKSLAGLSSEMVFYLDGIHPPWLVILLAPLAGVVLGLILAALVQRFGQAGAWTIWGIVMVSMVGQSFLPWEKHGFSLKWLIPVLVLACIAGSVWAVWTFLRAEVKA